MSALVSADPVPLATAAQFQQYYPSLCQAGPASDPATLAQTMVEASAAVESRLDRRLAPFSGHTFTDRLAGVDPDEFGDTDLPADIYGELGLSQARAYGASNLVRAIWLDQYAPLFPELWTYSIQTITLYLSVGSTIPVDPKSVEGPWPDSGFMRLRLGTFAPEGTTVVVVYGGGYTVGIPPNLMRLCRMEAAKLVLLDMEPEQRGEMHIDDLEKAIEGLYASWVKV